MTKHLTLLLFIGLAWGQQIAKTNKGKTVVLFDDGTWQYLEKNSVSKQVQTNETQIFITKSGKKYHLDGVKYAGVSPEKEVSELIKDQSYPDSLALPSHPKVNSDLKNISIKHLTKEQKRKYNKNKIIIKYGSGRKSGLPSLLDLLDLLFDNWYAIIHKSIFFPEKFNKVEFFIFTGYPEKAEIAKYNKKILSKSMFSLCSGLFLVALFPTIADEDGFLQNDYLLFSVIFAGPLIYSSSYYSKNKLEGASIKDAKIIAEKYNNDLMLRIFNEND